MNNIVSYIIRTKNESAFLAETIRRIRQQKCSMSQEIIVIDSGSTDSTLKIALQLADTVLKIAPEEFTWGRALNYGIENAKGDVCCLISGHCFLENDFVIEKAYEFLSNSTYCCLYGKQVGNPKLDKVECVELALQYPNEKIIKMHNGILPGISNACCLLKKAVWEKHHFDEVVQSAEDGYWFHEVVKNGFEPVNFADFCVVHGHPFSGEYIYRKWYWRTFHIVLMFDRGILQSYARIYMGILFHFLKAIIVYKQKSNVLGLKISFEILARYLYMQYRAILRARLDYKRNGDKEESYAQLKIPDFVSRGYYQKHREKFYD